MKILSRLVASGFLTGYLPLAPGTAGSAFAAVIYWIIPVTNRWIWSLVTLLIFFVGVSVARDAAEVWGEDARRIVVDEVAGFFMAMLFLPKTIFVVVLGFLLFRVLDIIKPFPAYRSQRLPGGWGIMADDAIAGLYTNLCLRIIISLTR